MTRAARCGLLAAALGLLPYAAMLLRAPGLTWDEAYYYPTFLDVRGWVVMLLQDPGAALSGAGIRAGWERINELPPLLKWLGALALAGDEGSPATLWRLRLLPAACFAATLWLLWATARRWLGAERALLAPALYAAHPVLFGHAQLAASETPMAMLVALALWLGTGGAYGRRALAVAAVLGLALATKVNGLVLLVAFAAWTLAAPALSRRSPGAPRGSDLLTVSMIVLLPPLLAFALWPWMWHGTAARLAEYRDFAFAHAHYTVWFLWERRGLGGEPLTPLYPWTMLAATAPVWWLAAVAGGIGLRLRRHLGRRRIDRADLLLLLAAAGPMAAASLPGTPRYDGIRLFLPAFAPAVLLAARGLGPWLGGLAQARRRVGAGLLAAALAANALPGHLNPFPLSFHNLPARALGVRDGEFAFERTFWGDALDREVLDSLNESVPPGARVKTLALQGDAFAILQSWGILRTDIVFDGPPPYDAHLVQDRKGFWGNSEWLIAGRREPLAAWHRSGFERAPLVLLFDGRPPGAD
ncbi:MAG: glycosyltransferase family 39 protein [Candidatus Sumerlaeia bacterium]|nr:glycosyltransferase family 39 protein [Candidatus Sumerlaeia bacterium]